jgi:ATP-dependent 26S proteasome regulatory subunit
MNNFVKYKGDDIILSQVEEQVESRYKILPEGIYKPQMVPTGMMSAVVGFDPIPQNKSLVKFTGGIIANTIKKINEFLNKETKDIYLSLKVAHKLGVILYGPPGTGKTCTAFLIMQEMVDKYKAICLDCTGNNVGSIQYYIECVRKLHNNPIVVFIDEFDFAIKHEEIKYLPFLDGITPNENLIIIGCTNNLDTIPNRIKNRPSRIKYNIEIKSFPIEVYKQFILDKMSSIKEKELVKFSYIAEEKGLTLDELKHVIIDHKIEKIDIELAIKNIKKYT